MTEYSDTSLGPFLGHIAIIGRPNVGKSTLFNVLLGRRRAITSPEYGVTRDVIDEQVFFQDFQVQLSDTGGIRYDLKGAARKQGGQKHQERQGYQGHIQNKASNTTKIDQQVQQSSLAILEKADLLLWVLALGEFPAEDKQLLTRLQPLKNKVFLVINKVDSNEKEIEAYNSYQYGFSNLFMVSALHRRGLKSLLQECITFLQQEKHNKLITPQTKPQTEQSQARFNSNIRFTLIGKPNTGKSSLCNMLTKAENSLVSDIPGTTRDILIRSFSRGEQIYELTDTAGIRRKSKVKENVEYYSVNRAIKNLDYIDIAVLVIDSQEGIQQQDKKIAQQIIKRGRGLIFALNKIDLLGTKKSKAVRELELNTRDIFPHLRYAPICCISALSGQGSNQLLQTIHQVYEQLNKRINTGLLNQALQDWMLFHAPPNKGSIRFKIRYLTQVEINPLRFILFVNRSKNFPQSYLQFLQNQLRQEFQFQYVPLQLHLRE